MNKKASWTLKPGERLQGGDKLEELIDSYLEAQREKHLMIFTEPDGTAYLVETDPEGAMISADVAVFYEGEYYFLPPDTAKSVAEAHLLHINLMSRAFEELAASLD